MSKDTRKDGLREAGIIADAVFDEQAEGSRGQQVAARIRRLIIERMNASAGKPSRLVSPRLPPSDQQAEDAMSEDWPCGAYEAHVDQKLSEWKENRHVKG